MENKIIEDYVSFETAKLLKEKGFDVRIETLIRPDGKIWRYDEYATCNCINKIPKNSEIKHSSKAVSCPTLNIAKKWLWICHNIYIMVFQTDTDETRKSKKNTLVYWYRIDKYKDQWFCVVTDNSKNPCKTPEEALESAIVYSLENLI